MNKPPAPNESDPRRIALMVVQNVIEKGGYANIILERYLRGSQLSADDRHLVTEIANGTIRMLKHLDWVLNLFLHKPLTTQNPWLRNVLRISIYQMLFMDKIPDYAIVNSAVQLVSSKAGSKLGGVANGVLRNLARSRDKLEYPMPVDSTAYLAVYYSQPEWLVEKWLADYGLEQVRAMLRYLNQRPSLTLRTNQLVGSRPDLMEALDREGIKCEPSPRTPWGLLVKDLDRSLDRLPNYQSGGFYVQNEASMLAVSILDPQPNEEVIDLCCGVGGKSTFMAEQMHNTGHIDAFELYEHKLSLLTANCRRLKISIVTGHRQDILQLPPDLFLASGVLLDAPCSGLGVLNRRADSRWRKSPESITNLTELQSALLEKAGQLVAPGGRLIYVTCTINRPENEDIVLKFLENKPEFYLEDLGPTVDYFPLDDQDKQQAAAGMLTLLPGKYQTDGMFYARMRRSFTR